MMGAQRKLRSITRLAAQALALFLAVLVTAVAAQAEPAQPAEPTAAADGIEAAIAAYARADYGRARVLLEPLAALGVPEAQYLLGDMAERGLNGPADMGRAVRLYQASAAASCLAARARLGILYAEGTSVAADLGVATDLGVAAAYLRQAAEARDAIAQYELARLTLEGRGVAADPSRAFFWLTLAIETPPGLQRRVLDAPRRAHAEAVLRPAFLEALIAGDVNEGEVHMIVSSADAWLDESPAPGPNIC